MWKLGGASGTLTITGIKAISEWRYRHIPPVLVEPFVGTDLELPVDYKFFVFDGRVESSSTPLGASLTAWK